MIMKKIVIVFIFVFFLFLYGCSNVPGGGGGSGLADENHGPGLEMTMDIDDRFLPSLEYTITFNNRGEEPIEISREDFEITTRQRNLDSANDIPIESESIEELKDDLFSEGSLQVPPNRDITTRGFFQIDEEYYNRASTEKLDLRVSLKYPYSTDFSNNLELDLVNYDVRSERIEMSGPIQITDIEGIFHTREDFSMSYTIEDVSRYSSSVSIDSLDLIFGNTNLNCEYYIEENGVRQSIDSPSLSRSRDTIYAMCGVDASNYQGGESISTMTEGEISYEYSINLEEEIEFPQ